MLREEEYEGELFFVAAGAVGMVEGKKGSDGVIRNGN